MEEINDKFLELEIKQSTIKNAGLGRFVSEDAKKGDKMKQLYFPNDVYVFNNAEEVEKAIQDKTILKEKIKDFVFTADKNNKDTSLLNSIFIAKSPGYVNHSNDPNARFEITKEYFCSYLIKDLKKGEEVFINYNNLVKVDWFEKYCREENLGYFIINDEFFK